MEKVWYTIGIKKQDGSIEFLRYSWTKDDAYTDDLGHALLFEYVREVPPLEIEDEFHSNSTCG